MSLYIYEDIFQDYYIQVSVDKVCVFKDVKRLKIEKIRTGNFDEKTEDDFNTYKTLCSTCQTLFEAVGYIATQNIIFENSKQSMSLGEVCMAFRKYIEIFNQLEEQD